MKHSHTSLSDSIDMLGDTYNQLNLAYDPEIFNPLCLCGAAAATALVEVLLTHPPELFTEEEINLVVDVHDLAGEILKQYDTMEIDE